jgi:CTP:molybdopterin cytidylyltransferase MocA
VEALQATEEDGVLDIVFTRLIDMPKVSAIEIERVE